MLNDYNQIDFENDSITVIRAKLEAIAKALNNRANAANNEEKEAIEEILNKPLGEWP
jgi:hypothetical protein